MIIMQQEKLYAKGIIKVHKKTYRKRNQTRLKRISLLIILVISITYILNAGFNMIFSNETNYTTFSKKANQHLKNELINDKGQLILQNDKKYADLAYGSGSKENTIAKNGCAIISLAIVNSFINRKDLSVKKILKWAKNDYYSSESGTSWAIFESFANKYGYNYQDLASNYSNAKYYLDLGYPVIVSVTKGKFTKTGHIMVIVKDKNNKLRVLDPNDNDQKQHYQTKFKKQEIIEDVIHYWVIY